MKKIFLTYLLFASFLFAQTEQKSIELPDFVITGTQTIDVQKVQKKKPELISTLSQDFFTPQYSPMDLPLLFSSAPVPVKPAITANEYFQGLVKVGVGNNTFPTGDFHLSKAFGNYLVSANAWGTNIKDYVANSGYNTSGVSLDNILFVSTKSDFLPGTQIRLNGEYSRSAYKFYGSNTPTLERKTDKGFGNFSVSNDYGRWVNFAANFGVNYLSDPLTNLKERIVKSGVLLEVNFGGMTIGGIGGYSKQLFNTNLGSADTYDFYSAEGYIKAELGNNIRLKGGIYYAGDNNNSMFIPFASGQMLLGNGITIFVQYKPHVNHFTLSDLFKRNMYLNPVLPNIFSKVKSDLNGTIKYEYLKYFSIGLSSGYSKVDNFLYFDDSLLKGRFDAFTASDVDYIFVGLNLLFHPARLGYFYGDVKYQKVTDSNGNFIPYEPKLSAELIYGYDFEFGLGVKAGYKFSNDIFTNISNTNKLKDYQNISFGISYKLLEGLSLTADFHNILNKSNFVLKGYEEKPFDILVGAEYRW